MAASLDRFVRRDDRAVPRAGTACASPVSGMPVIQTILTVSCVADRVRPAVGFAVWTATPLMAVETRHSGAGMRD